MTLLDTLIQRFGTSEGELTVGGLGVTRLAHQAGSTPFFAYDRDAITHRVQTLRAALPGDVRLSYAVKANPMPAIVQHLAGLVDRFDVASAKEMLVALDAGAAATAISFAGPGKTLAELTQAVAAGVTVELESEGEARRILQAGEAVGRTPRVALRVNPAFEIKGSGMRMGGGPQQFGVDQEQAPALLQMLRAADVELVGMHIFGGSQNLKTEVVAQAHRRTAELIVELAAGADLPIRYVNTGGGLGIPYYETDGSVDLEAFGKSLAETLDEVIRPALPEAEHVIELGRFIVGEAGVYVSRVVDRKISRGRTYLVLDGGLHHQLAASGNFGQVIRRNFPIVVGNRATEQRELVASVVGCSCTPLDLLGSDVALADAEPGDLIVIFQAGAYGLTASPTEFLSHPHAIEMLV